MKKKRIVLGLSLALGLVSIATFAEESYAADMYRLYNKNSGEHFYTANTNEKNNLVRVGWKYEGIGWTAPSSGTPVYRLYNKNAGDHHYTLNNAEKNNLVKVGWKYEGVGWYSDTKKTVPLYRAYNPNAKAGSHNYTTNYGEQQNLLRVGWRNEGISWYGIKKTTAPTPVTKYTVTVRHIGSDGKTLKTTTATVNKGTNYTAKAEGFGDYTLQGSNSQTVNVNGNKTITFNYKKNPTSEFSNLPEKTPTYSASMSVKFESALNAYRAQKGIKALPIGNGSRATSKSEAQANTSTNYMAWRALHGYSGIATTFAKSGSVTEDQAVTEAMTAFKNSPGHNANMLETDPDFASDFGGGVYVMKTTVGGQTIYSFVFNGTFGW